MNILRSFLKAMSNYFNTFSKSYPANFLNVKSLLGALALSFASYYLLNSIKPFGLSALGDQELFKLLMIIFGVVFLIAMVFQFLIPIVFKSIYNYATWTGTKQLFHLLTLFATASITSFIIIHKETSQVNFGLGLLCILAPILVLFVLLVPTLRNKAEKSNSMKAEELNNNLRNRKFSNPQKPFEMLHFEGVNQTLNLLPNQLLDIEIKTNKAIFRILEGDKTAEKEIDINKKSILAGIKDYDQFSVLNDGKIINLKSIIDIKSNAAGFNINTISKNVFLRAAELKKIA